ncbi:MAG: acetylesterase, partial [Planctomycetes bacterium]|nr:acetylesterase [Planctomycetota bacterium]
MFASDPRFEFGRALTEAEKQSNSGHLDLIRWRNGETKTVTLKLPVLGTYSATAPFDCPKSTRILELGCRNIAAKIAAGTNQQEPITRCLNALALLASGNADYLPLVHQEAVWAADFSADNMQSWRYSYVIMLLSEYVTATGDQSVMPGLRRLALAVARGQSAVGSWGHGFALPDGRLGGYGMMNAPGVPLTVSLIMARDAGVTDAALDRAIERSDRLLRFYIGKGAIPYGDHAPWIETHEDNGKCGIAAVMFNQLGNADGAKYFSHMSLASHGAERDCGHTGNFFNILWALPGVAQSGPHATGAWMHEFGSWYFDLARRADGSFLHQGPPELEPDSYHHWDATGAILLGYAIPLNKIRLTGKDKPGLAPQLDAAAAQAFVQDGRGWTNADRTSFYSQLSDGDLLERLGSWSIVVRERAAMELARRQEPHIKELIAMLNAAELDR